MNFRIVKKPWGFVLKQDKTDDELKKSILEKKTGGWSEEQISLVALLYIVSTIRPGSAVGAGRSLYREPSFSVTDLTLPLVNPPRSRGLI